MAQLNYLPYVGLPNILAGRFIVPELLQNDANPEKLSTTILNMISDKTILNDIRTVFTGIHEQLRQNNDEKAAQAILAYLK